MISLGVIAASLRRSAGGGGGPEVPGPTPTYINKGALATGGNAAAAPVGTDANSIILLVLEHANETPFAAPAGFTEIMACRQGVGTAGGADGEAMQVFWQRGTSGSVTIPHAGNHVYYQQFAFGGCRQDADPWEVIAVDNVLGSAAVTFPAVTTSVDNRLIVNIITHSINDSNPSSYTSSGNLASTSWKGTTGAAPGNDGAIGLGTGTLNTAGSSGNPTGNNIVTTVSQCRATIALRGVPL